MKKTLRDQCREYLGKIVKNKETTESKELARHLHADYHWGFKAAFIGSEVKTMRATLKLATKAMVLPDGAQKAQVLQELASRRSPSRSRSPRRPEHQQDF